MTPADFRAIRQRLGLSQAEFGAAIGRHPNTVARMERGEKPISPSTEAAVGLLDAARRGRRVRLVKG